MPHASPLFVTRNDTNQWNRRFPAIALVTLIVCMSGFAGISAAEHGDLHVSVSNVTVTPERPSPGEQTTIAVTIRNAESSVDAYEVTDVFIRRPDSTTDLVRAEALGSVPIGSTMQVPLTLSFDQTGVHDLRVIVVGHHEDGSRRLEYPLAVSVVEEELPQLNLEDAQPMAGVETPVTISVSNGAAMDLQSLELSVGGPTAQIRNPRRVASQLGAGEEQSFSYSVQFKEVGRTTLDATLNYRTPNGETKTVHEQFTIQVDEEEVPRITLAEGNPIAGIETAVNVSILNGASFDIESLEISLDGSTAVIRNSRRVVSQLQAGETVSFVYSIKYTEPGETPLDVTLRYRTQSSETRTINEQFIVQVDDPDESIQLARIELTGVDIERTGDQMTITGSASNVGLNQANSVVVRVVPAAGVTPIPPNREYFVGTIPGSDFVSFDLTARVDANISEIPIEVTYIANGLQRTESVTVPVDQSIPDRESQQNPSPSGGGGFLSMVGSVLAIVGVVAIAVIGWRRWRGGRS